MKLSIIIPLYNTEKLISKCILSALEQDLPQDEYEILVIDDGSTDSSAAVVKELTQRYPNIRLFSKPNEGLSMTRNYGTDRAAGQYILYLDSDDYLHPNILKTIVETMKQEHLDMLAIDVNGVDEQDQVIPLWLDGHAARLGTSIQRGRKVLRDNKFLPMVYAYIYSRDFLNRHALRMAPIWHEDEEFTPRALYYAERLAYRPIRVYNYLQRHDSFMSTYKPENLFQLAKGMRSLSRFADSIEADDPEGAQYIRWRIAQTAFSSFRRSVWEHLGNTRALAEYYRKEGIMPLQFKRSRMKYRLLNHALPLFILYYKLHKPKEQTTPSPSRSK